MEHAWDLCKVSIFRKDDGFWRIETYRSAALVFDVAELTCPIPRTPDADVIRLGFHAPKARLAWDGVYVRIRGSRGPEIGVRRTGLCNKSVLGSGCWGGVSRWQWFIIGSILGLGHPVLILGIGPGLYRLLPLGGTGVVAVGERHGVLVAWSMCWFLGGCFAGCWMLEMDVLYH